MLRYHDKQLLPLRLSTGKTFRSILDLLLLSDGEKYHFVLIIDLLKLVSKISGKEYRDRNFLCRKCFHVSASEESFPNDSVQIRMPEPGKNKLVFDNYAAIWFSPFVVYLDLESLIKPVSTVKNRPETSSTSIFEQHQPCSYCIMVIERNNPTPIHFDIYTGPGCMERLLAKLEKLARFFYNQKRKFLLFYGVAPSKKAYNCCWICNNELVNDAEKVLNHCHFIGSFIGYAHNECNLKRRNINFTPIVAHNMMNYDMHHIVKALHSASGYKNLHYSY